MREDMDCAVLMIAPHEGWMWEWLAAVQPLPAVLRLHPYPLHTGGQAPPATVLADHAMPLRRFDACLLPVKPATLAWTRTALACARSALTTPLFALAESLQAVALQDLLAGGAADFVRAPFCLEELRARVSRRARREVPPAAGVPPQAPALLRETRAAYGPAAALRGPPRDAGRTLDALNAVPPILAGESFRQAKLRIVASFEQEYVRRALNRHGGNVARAARASAKHRRAFWAVMQKHGIDAAGYRRGGHSRMGDSEN